MFDYESKDEDAYKQAQEIGKKAFDASRPFKRLFTGENLEDGKKVLSILEDFVGFPKNLLPTQSDGDIAPLKMAKIFGRLEMLEHLKSYIHFDHDKRDKMVQDYYNVLIQNNNDRII